MGKNTKVIIIVIVVALLVAVIAGVILYNFLADQKQLKILNEEIVFINKTKAANTDIKTKGKYQKLEKAIKDYYTQYSQEVKKVEDIYKNTTMTTALSISNIEKDAPAFVTTKAKLENFKAQQNTQKDKINEMVNEGYLESKAKEYNLDSKQTLLFKQSLNLKEDAQKMAKIVSLFDECADSINKVLDFLSQNKDNWTVKNNSIMFNKSSFLTEYNKLISEFKTVQRKLVNEINV